MNSQILLNYNKFFHQLLKKIGKVVSRIENNCFLSHVGAYLKVFEQKQYYYFRSMFCKNLPLLFAHVFVVFTHIAQKIKTSSTEAWPNVS